MKNQILTTDNTKTSSRAALKNLGLKLRSHEVGQPISFQNFLQVAASNPRWVFRDIFQLFYDMVHYYVDADTKTIRDNGSLEFEEYHCANLFETGCDNPFFADRLFINRFMKLTDGFKKGVQNNHIFLFEGPPGSGKSTFLNNLIKKFEDYSNTAEGNCFEIFWRLDVKKLGGYQRVERLVKHASLEKGEEDEPVPHEELRPYQMDVKTLPPDFVEFSCPNHDHPILLIPKDYRRQFLDELIPDQEFKKELFNDRQYEWVFKDAACSICTSLYTNILNILGDPIKVLDMAWARKTHFNRQFGEGVSVFNSSDPIYKGYITSPTIQGMVNSLLKNDKVAYIHSNLARTNNGILALMDIKDHNINRLIKLHGIISDGVHKVGLIEERVKSIFIGLVNPGDKVHYEEIPSFKDRVISLNVPYVLDYRTEVRIYKNKFGEGIATKFLPQILENVARIIVSSRLNEDSPAVRKWIRSRDKYYKYLDDNYLLLRMEIYSGNTPNWLSEEDLKRLDQKTMKRILAEAETEGNTGFSGRQSLNVFNDLFTRFGKGDKLITMDMVSAFFSKRPDLEDLLPEGFLEAIKDMYDFSVLQEVKESIYSYNREHIARDIQNYIYAVNFEVGDTKVSHFTGDTIEITDDYLKKFEMVFLGSDCTRRERRAFRSDILNEYVSQTLSQDMQLEGKALSDTHQFKKLFDKYTHNLKENSLVIYLDNENFRRAIKDFNTNSFNTYDQRLRLDVNNLVQNLCKKFNYTEEGAKQVSIYVLDKNLAREF